MKKHLFSSLGLALMMLVWGGASEVKAQLQLQEVTTLNFDNDKASYIPVGWTLYNEVSDVRASGTYKESGPRLFDFPNTDLFERALYLRTYSDNMTYAVYGDLEGYQLSIPAGIAEIQIPAFLWDQTSGKVKVDILKYEEGKDLSDLEVVKSQLQSITATTGSSGENAELSAVDTIKVRFQNDTKANYVVKIATSAIYTYFGITGLVVKCDPLAVFAETFSGISDSYTPAAGSGWLVYAPADEKDASSAAVAKNKNANYSGAGSRVFVLTGSSDFSSAMYHQSYGYDARKYETYGESADGEPTLTLEADTKYRISFDAAAWYETPDIRFYLLDTDGNVVASLTKNLTAKISDRASTDKPEHIELTADITKTGNYILKFTSAGQILYSNIVIRKDLTTALEENFSELHNSVPSTGWIFYNNGSAVKQGSSVSSGARVFKISGYDAITNVAYLGWNGTCYLTYGEENSGKSLTLVAGQEYRITYYAANWDGNTEYTRTMACEITGADGQGVVFSRKDELSGVCNGVAGSAAFKKNPDFIQATFTPEKSGNYILKFTGLNAAVANISIKTNEDGVAYVSSLDKFGYTSLYLDQAVSLPDGVTAYIGKLNAAKDAIVLTELEGEVIPANTGVILVGDANAELKFYPTTASATTPTGNILQGVVKGTKASSSDDVYVLGYKSSDKAPAFYKNTTKKIEATTTITIDEGANKATIVTDYKIQEGSTNSTDRTEATDDWTTTTTTTNSDNEQVTTTKVNYEAGTKTKSYEYVQVIRANKAYFVLPASDPATASSIRIQFGEDTDEPGNVTAIERIETEAAPAARVIYDLSGRRLTDMSKPGLYIVNGRKMLVK